MVWAVKENRGARLKKENISRAKHEEDFKRNTKTTKGGTERWMVHFWKRKWADKDELRGEGPLQINHRIFSSRKEHNSLKPTKKVRNWEHGANISSLSLFVKSLQTDSFPIFMIVKTEREGEETTSLTAVVEWVWCCIDCMYGTRNAPAKCLVLCEANSRQRQCCNAPQCQSLLIHGSPDFAPLDSLVENKMQLSLSPPL